MKKEKKNLIILLSFLLLFSAFSYSLLKKSLWDYDFWWHIATGKYIVENGSLPEKDPFSFTSELEENRNLRPKRESLILKQYWLAQVLFYLVYSAAGAKGMIMFRSLLLVLFLTVISWALYRRNVRFYVIFVFTFIAYLAVSPFTGERPVLFTLLFSVITFLILDDFARNRGRKIYVLPLLMLLWSNMHGGFILGDVIILMFMIGEFMNILFKKTTYTRKELTVFYAVAVLSLFTSMINPNGLNAFLVALSSKYGHFRKDIQEHQPPLMMYMNRVVSVNWGYISMILLFPVIFIRIKKISFTHLLLISGLLFKSLMGIRFTIFYSSIGAIILASELNVLIEQLFLRKASLKLDRKLASVFTLAVFLSSVTYFAGVVHFESFSFKPATWYSVPKEGADFIEENRLPGNMYNDFGAGGYLAWRLYPWKKNFIDTRGLNYNVRFESRAIHAAQHSVQLPVPGRELKADDPLWKRLLSHYDINLLFLIPMDETGQIPRLIFELSEDDEWIPIYTDHLSVIYIRNTPENHEIITKFRRSTDDVYKTVLLQSSMRAKSNRKNPWYLVSIGETFHKMGRLEDALTAYEYADKRLPGRDSIIRKINQVKSELELAL